MTDTSLDPRFSDPEAQPTAWADGLVYRLKATKAFGFAKGPFSQTRWRFDP